MLETIRQIVSWGRVENPNRIRVLAITTDDRDKRALSACSVRGHWDLVMTGACEEALEIVKKGGAAVILYDRDLPGLDWRDALRLLADATPACPVILTSPVNDGYLWGEVIRRGGYDVLAKPLQEDRTVRFVRLAWSLWNKL